MRRILAILALCCAVVTAPAVAQEKTAFDHAGLARQVLERHIAPGYEKLHAAGQDLEAAVKKFCNAVPGSGTDALKAAFADTVLAFSRIEHVMFGPVMQKERHARLLYWPDHKAIGWRQVRRTLASKTESVLSRGSLEEKSVALQGFGAFEQVLYGAGSEELARAGAARDFRCGFMAAIAANVSHIAREVLNDWTGEGGYRETFLEPGPGNRAYLKPPEVTLDIAKTMLTGLEQLRDYRIAGPLGLQRGSTRKRRAAFARSGLSTRAVTANLEGLINLYTEGGLKQRIDAHEPGMGDAILNDLEQSRTFLESIALPMKEAVENDGMESKLMAVGYPLKNARNQVARVLADAAGLSLGFNALDGD